MALTREFIRKLAKESDVELPKEFIDGIIAEHTSARDAFADEMVKAEIAKKPEGVTDVKESDDYKALQKSFDDYKAEIAGKETKAAKEKAFRSILKDACLSDRGIEKAVKYANFDDFELDGDGSLKNAKSYIKAAQEEWAEYVVSQKVTGANTANPPSNVGGEKQTKASIYKKDQNGRYVLSASERQKALTELMGR